MARAAQPAVNLDRIRSVLADADGQDEDGPDDDGRVVLFTVRGKEYTAPRKVGANIALAYLRDVRRKGQEYALAGLVEKVLGPEVFDELADDDDLTGEELDMAMQVVHTHAMGAIEGGGKGPAATKR